MRPCYARRVTWILIAIGGAAGAVSRYAVDVLVTERVGSFFPFGTMLINLSGSFALATEGSALPAAGAAGQCRGDRCGRA